MEGGRGRFCDFEDDSPVVVVDDDDVLFVDSEVSLNELSLLSSVIGSSNRDTPGQQNWPIFNMVVNSMKISRNRFVDSDMEEE